MIIRPATPHDIPAIVSLLRISLGETLMPKSEGYWRWKHVENPFGESPVLLAEEENSLVGVRAFMRWKFSDQHNTIEAVRAVDTATHPSFQGKGIFSKLTKQLIADCTEKYHLIYNTPNSKSMPGYLKMGWVQAGQLSVEVKALRPVAIGLNAILKTNVQVPKANRPALEYFVNHCGVEALLAEYQAHHPSGIFRTFYSSEYLRWRYCSVPVAEYEALGVESGNDLRALLVFRLKATRWGLEFRVTDLFYRIKSDLADLLALLRQKAKDVQADFITFTGDFQHNVLSGVFSGRTKSLGPMVTVRDLQPGAVVPFKDFSKWSPSLGDLELF